MTVESTGDYLKTVSITGQRQDPGQWPILKRTADASSKRALLQAQLSLCFCDGLS